jgi:hypothetical protein
MNKPAAARVKNTLMPLVINAVRQTLAVVVLKLIKGKGFRLSSGVRQATFQMKTRMTEAIS